MSEAPDQGHQWRASLLEGSLRVFTVLALVFAVAGAVAPVHARWVSLLLAAVACSALMASMASRIGYRMRGLIMLAGIHVICSAILLHSGVVAPNTSAAFLLEAVLATLLFGRRAGLATVLCSALTFLASSWLAHAGGVTRPADWYRSFDMAQASVAIRVGIAACGVGTAAVFGISHLLSRLERAITQRDQARVELEEMHAERVRVLTELEQREAEFLRARELEVLGRLASFVAHDFNNALLAIFGGVELLRRARNDKEHSDALSLVQGAATQAASTAKQLRAFGPQPRREARPVDPAQVIRTAERMLRTLLPKSIAISVLAEPTPRINADEGLLQGALMNLALNAWDAMREGGELSIRVRNAELPAAAGGGMVPDVVASGVVADAARSGVVIEVRDSGSGMDEATRARVFAPFFTTKGSGGSGLGLASVRQTVEAAGGSIAVQTALGQGTNVQLFWPVVSDAAQASVPVPPQVDEVSGKVLALDDDHAVRSTVATYLRRCGSTAFEAATQDEARQLTAAQCTDVLATARSQSVQDHARPAPCRKRPEPSP